MNSGTSYAKGIRTVLEELGSSVSGLAAQEAAGRLNVYGRNVLREPRAVSPLGIFAAQFRSFIMGILVAAILISVFIGHSADAVVIAVILVGNAVFGFTQEYKAEKSIAALRRLTGLRAKVRRDDRLEQIEAEYVVPGDILELETGDKIPADCRLIEASDFTVMEATLTGESEPVVKSTDTLDGEKSVGERTNMAFSGTLVTSGNATGVVVATGMETEIGTIAELMEASEERPTPLQQDLRSLGTWLGFAAIVICIIIFVLQQATGRGSLIEILMAAIGLAVAAIPEGLPAVVTISLALGVQRMGARNALVRRLPSVETLGCCSVICTDKTGTLTHNQMTVRRLFCNNEVIDVTGDGYSVNGTFSRETEGLRDLLRIGALCNNASLTGGEVVGDPTEGALIVSAAKAGLVKRELDTLYERAGEVPFDSKKKFMATYHRYGGGRLAMLKGAPETVVDRCSKVLLDKEERPLTAQMKRRILDQYDAFAGEALRVLGFAYSANPPAGSADAGGDFVFAGLQAMIDPPRKETAPAVERCRRAGIKVVMITGDYEKTAVAIARRIGIEGEVLSGGELDGAGDLRRVVDRIGVYARVSPEHKMKIIEALRENGNIIAMTGDGVNDSPALKNADIGVAIGSGTDVAKEASDMVLLDDDFSSIVTAVEEGRIIYDNIKKFVNYLLSSNFGEVLVILAATLLGWPLPLLALQILWINLVTDGLPALALGVDPGNPAVMNRKPRRISDRIMDGRMNFNVLFMGALIAAGTLFMFRYGLGTSVELARTLAFSTLIVLEIVRVQIIRADHNENLLGNRWLIGALSVSVILQLAVIYTPLSRVFATVRLNAIHWMYILGTAAALLAVNMLVRGILGRIARAPSA